MPKRRVLIVDDSTVIRRLLCDALAGDPAIEVAGTAANGRIALAKIPQVSPDLITLDLEMPEMDGLTTLVELRKSYPQIPVIIFSTITQREAVAPLYGLPPGASDFIAKPANLGSIPAAVDIVRGQLIPKIRRLSGLVEPQRSSSTNQPLARSATAPRPTASAPAPIELIAIGASTGGPNALAEIFSQLPGDLPAPIVIVQHMPPLFTKYLAERLDAISALTVREANAGEIIVGGGAWIAPGDFHLALARSGSEVKIQLHQGAPENSCRPAADVLFRSVAEVYGRAALAVVLTGMGQDGLRGCQALRAARSQILAQDEATSVVWGMPGAVAAAGLADAVLPLSLLAREICRRASRRRGFARDISTSATA